MSPSISKVANILSLIIAGILVLLPFHAVFTTWIGSNVQNLDLIRIWKEIILFAVTPLAFWVGWKQPKLKKWLTESWIVRLFGIYILLHLIVGAWALKAGNLSAEALIYSLIINLRFIGFFIICYLAASSSKVLKDNWRSILLIPAGIVIFFGLIQKFLLPYDFLRHFGYGPSTIPAYQTVDSNIDYRRIQSTLRGANPLGAYLVLIIPALLLLIKSEFLKVAALASAFIVLFFTYSRSAWVGTVIAIGIILLWSIRRVKKLPWILGAVLTCVTVGFLLASNNQAAEKTILHSNDSSVSESSNSVRLDSLKRGASDIIHEPLGRGPGTAGPASTRNDQSARISENYYLQIGQEVGVVGMILFAGINVLVGLELWKRKNEVLPRILLASLAGLTFVDMLSHAWTDDTLCYLWWGFAGIALAPLAKTKKKL